MTSRKMRAPSARGRHTSPPRVRANASWTSARSARARGRTPRRKLPDGAVVEPAHGRSSLQLRAQPQVRDLRDEPGDIHECSA